MSKKPKQSRDATPIKTIGFIGDIHCGSHYGLWPLEDLPARGYKGVRYLMECFHHLVESWPKLDLLILMGDLIDGKNKKSDGTGLFTANLGEQVAGAIAVLEPLAEKSSLIYRVHGTPYHEDFHNGLGALDKTLGVKISQQVIDIALGEHVLNVAHHPMGGGALYNGTSMDKEGLWARLAADSSKAPNCRWIVRAHRHFRGILDDGRRCVVQTPCWELPTPHAKKVNYWRFQPDIGGLLMLHDPEEDSGYRFRFTEYPVPKPEIITPCAGMPTKTSQSRRPGKNSTKKPAKISKLSA